MRTSTILLASILASSLAGCQKIRSATAATTAPTPAAAVAVAAAAIDGSRRRVHDPEHGHRRSRPAHEVTYCYYFHTPNTAPVAINKWVSDMTPGSHHMIFFTGGVARTRTAST